MGWEMMSEYLLGDEDYGGGPSGNTGCGCLVLIVAGIGLGTFGMCLCTGILFTTMTQLF